MNFQPKNWDAGLDKTAAEFMRIQEKYGRDRIAQASTGQLLTEEFYTLGKLVCGVIGTNNYDGNATLCMAFAVLGYKPSLALIARLVATTILKTPAVSWRLGRICESNIPSFIGVSKRP
jgi:predicted molibdopterin-dependent oxidoreductase YjgC